jgi:hypothetical protein
MLTSKVDADGLKRHYVAQYVADGYLLNTTYYAEMRFPQVFQKL